MEMNRGDRDLPRTAHEFIHIVGGTVGELRVRVLDEERVQRVEDQVEVSTQCGPRNTMGCFEGRKRQHIAATKKEVHQTVSHGEILPRRERSEGRLHELAELVELRLGKSCGAENAVTMCIRSHTQGLVDAVTCQTARNDEPPATNPSGPHIAYATRVEAMKVLEMKRNATVHWIVGRQQTEGVPKEPERRRHLGAEQTEQDDGVVVIDGLVAGLNCI